MHNNLLMPFSSKQTITKHVTSLTTSVKKTATVERNISLGRVRTYRITNTWEAFCTTRTIKLAYFIADSAKWGASIIHPQVLVIHGQYMQQPNYSSLQAHTWTTQIYLVKRRIAKIHLLLWQSHYYYSVHKHLEFAANEKQACIPRSLATFNLFIRTLPVPLFLPSSSDDIT